MTAGPRRVVLLQTQAEAAGAQEISRRLAATLTARGHEVTQVFLFRRTDAFDQEPRTVMCATARPRTPLQLGRLLRQLHRTLREIRPDTVICFQHYGNLIGAPAARLAGIRHVIANHNGLQDLLAKPVVWLDRAIGTLGLYSDIVVNSGATAEEYGAYPAAYRGRLRRIDHGFQRKPSRLDREAARKSFGLPDGATLLGSVARLAPKKHLDAAVRLLALEPGWHLALAGQGPARPDLEALARELGCRERLHFAGELSSERIGDFLQALDVFVFPSQTETFGLAAVEAAEAGVPVVANRLAAMEEVLAVDAEPCALFVDVDDISAFRDAVARMLSDPETRATLTARGRRLGERFSLDSMADGYEALLARGPGRAAAAAASGEGARPAPAGDSRGPAHAPSALAGEGARRSRDG